MLNETIFNALVKGHLKKGLVPAYIIISCHVISKIYSASLHRRPCVHYYVNTSTAEGKKAIIDHSLENVRELSVLVVTRRLPEMTFCG